MRRQERVWSERCRDHVPLRSGAWLLWEPSQWLEGGRAGKWAEVSCAVEIRPTGFAVKQKN